MPSILIYFLLFVSMWFRARCREIAPLPSLKPTHLSISYNVDYFRDECESPHLVCTPERDCVVFTPGSRPEGRRCPINFSAVRGYCIFASTQEYVYDRSHIQSHDYCLLLDSRSYYFQSSQEWNDLESAIKSGLTPLIKDEYYWIDAYWEDQSRYRWEWRTTEEEIVWEKILKGTTCAQANLNILETKAGCLGVHLNSQKDCLLLHNVDCIKKLNTACKLGIHNSRCSENGGNVCCYSPSYNYYAQNVVGGPGSHGTHGESKAECWVSLPNKNVVVECSKAFDLLGNLVPLPQPLRVEGSFFYFSREEPCHGERLAVISSPEVHKFIFGYMMTEEKKMIEERIIIGLNYDAKDDRFTWSNGKIITYYNTSYWAAGQPNKHGGLGANPCVAYRKSGVNSYAWHLIPTAGCIGEKTLKVCELPIRATNLIPTPQKLECGQRLERGVLAKSAYYDFEYDQAQYGEFPWHAAVVQAQNYRGGVVVLFACSGALVHRDFVLTSAHCVALANSDFSVSLGDWDLSDDADHLLDTLLVKVAEIIIHPGYKATENVNDIALLRLQTSVRVESLPHIGLGCLPNPELFYQHAGEWECFTLGWPAEIHKDRRERRVLQRVETDVVPKIKCRYYIKSLTPNLYGDHNTFYSSAQYGYDKHYGFHHVSYKQHGYFDSRTTDLLCTEPFETSTCINDPTAMLVCRKANAYYSSPFTSYGHEDYGRSYNKYQFANTRIINAFGKNRFDSEKWYVMGVGHSLSSCEGTHGSLPHYSKHRRYTRPYQVFTPVEDYLSFIHSHLDARF
ncbi:hypothetical protein SK128_021152 [Halocaridina rubra]|uniref:Uncharacterized protein n=1 Tax=Halocaridina rubra TaxID=373956 RepID=A0AAN8XFY9_HALRR